MELSKGLVSAITKKAGFTVEQAVAEGFVKDDRIVNNFTFELEASLSTSKTAMNVIKSASTIEEVLKNLKPQTVSSLYKKTLAQLKDKLESKACNMGVVVGADDVHEFEGTLNLEGDGSSVGEYRTYGAMLLRSIIKESYKNTGIKELMARRSVIDATTEFLDTTDGAWEMMDEFNENFSMALAEGTYALGLGVREYTITKEDSEVHEKVLIQTMENHGLLEAFQVSINETANEIVANSKKEEVEMKEETVEGVEEVATTEVAEEIVTTTEMVEESPAEEVVTIGLAEYNSLLAIEATHKEAMQLLNEAEDRNKRASDLMSELVEKIDEYKATAEAQEKTIKTIEKEMSIVIKANKALEAKLEKAEKTAKTTKEETVMTEFKITINDLKEVAARPAKENKVTSKEDIKDIKVDVLSKSRVVAVDAGKKVTAAVRDKAPEVIVKVANGTHTGIDKVATLAHKTTNVVAKSTNTVVLKSANAVDAVLDFIAPTYEAVSSKELFEKSKDMRNGDTVTFNGRKYEKVDGRLVIQK